MGILKIVLNFSPAHAEIIIMKSNMQYVIFILLIFSLQIIFYSTFKEYENGVSKESVALELMKKKNNQLQFEIANLKGQPDLGRLPASIRPSLKNTTAEPVDLSDFYFSKSREYKKHNNNALALQYLDKVIQVTLKSENIAKALYSKIEIKCGDNLEEACLAEIDILVTQHPESRWTGQSLNLLSNYYLKHKRVSDADSLKKIIKQNFLRFSKNNESLQL